MLVLPPLFSHIMCTRNSLEEEEEEEEEEKEEEEKEEEEEEEGRLCQLYKEV